MTSTCLRKIIAASLRIDGLGRLFVLYAMYVFVMLSSGYFDARRTLILESGHSSSDSVFVENVYVLEAQVLLSEYPVFGAIQVSGERHTYVLQAQAMQPVIIFVSSLGDTQLDPFLEVADPTGKIVRGDSMSPEEIEQIKSRFPSDYWQGLGILISPRDAYVGGTIPISGTYTVVVGSTGPGVGGYLLVALLLEPLMP